MQSQQLYGLVRVAMGNQYKAELDMQKHLMLQTTAAVCGAVVVCGLGYPQRFQPIASGDQLRKTALLTLLSLGDIDIDLWRLRLSKF